MAAAIAGDAPMDADNSPGKPPVEAEVDPRRRQVLRGLAATGAGLSLLTGATADQPAPAPAAAPDADHKLRAKIKTVVVIYAENRSFNNLFAGFPGLAQPLDTAPSTPQLDRDGKTPLSELPPIWGGLVPRAQTVGEKRYMIPEGKISSLPNKPFPLSDGEGQPLPLGLVTRDLVHRFYTNQMQINGGRSDQFVAWGDSGGLVMGHYAQTGAELKLWKIAQAYTLCDNFFMAAFGGSFLNHLYLISGQTPLYPDAMNSPAAKLISVIEGEDPKGSRLKLAADSPGSALEGPPRFERDSALTPDGYAVNTMAPPYQPSYVRPAPEGDPLRADPTSPNVLPPQSYATIGDRLSDKNVSWAWYSGAWQAALDHKGSEAVPNFQYHHQPFNYFSQFAPGTAARDKHIRDAGTGDTAATNHFIKDIEAGRLPAVSFYKPQGNLNLHAGYADVASGDAHIAHVIGLLERSPQWKDMAVIVTFDENGGWWDHVAPPQGDRWGPGSRIPALVISPHARRGHVDHTPCDTNSILRFITRLHGLEPLPGVKGRDIAMQSRGQELLGDLTHALHL
jgi:acid phosphatase